MHRAQTASIIKDLHKKIVFLVGPRQVGKTWLAKEVAKEFAHALYLNYDRAEDRDIIRQEAWLESTELLILDELHKMKNWKNYLKGVYDTKSVSLKILVTGSARLDTWRRSGDSLAGRYFTHHLLPFSPAELKNEELGRDLDRFIERGGFPEPFLSESGVEADRWRLQYIDGLLRKDILDFEVVHDLRAMELVLELLRARVGSPLSIASLARDVSVSPNTVKRYLDIFAALYIVFSVPPYARNIARSLSRMAKIYFFDTGFVSGDSGAKYENFMALNLLKHVYYLRDYQGKTVELRYVRTKDGKEVDFCLVEENKPQVIIEVKNSDNQLDPSLKFFADRYNLAATQVVKELKRERKYGKIELRRALDYCRSLDL